MSATSRRYDCRHHHPFEAAGGRPYEDRSGCAACSVRDVAVCAALGRDEIPHLERIVINVDLAAGGTLVDQEGSVTDAFSVTSGVLRMVRLLPDGRRQIIGFLLPGDFVGMSSATCHQSAIEAVTEARLCRFPLTALRALFERFPQLEHRLVDMAGEELRAAHDQIVLLGRKTPVEKVACFLLRIAERGNRWNSGGSRLHLPMTRADIADYLGLTIETVSRTFTRLRSERVIALPEATEVEILDRPRLEALAEAA